MAELRERCNPTKTIATVLTNASTLKTFLLWIRPMTAYLQSLWKLVCTVRFYRLYDVSYCIAHQFPAGYWSGEKRDIFFGVAEVWSHTLSCLQEAFSSLSKFWYVHLAHWKFQKGSFEHWMGDYKFWMAGHGQLKSSLKILNC